jgi:hypothetical protein
VECGKAQLCAVVVCTAMEVRCTTPITKEDALVAATCSVSDVYRVWCVDV